MLNTYQMFLAVLLHISGAIAGICLFFALILPSVAPLAQIPITIATYLLLILGLDLLLKHHKVPLPHLLAAIIILAPGFYIPYQLNRPLWDKINQLRSKDIPLPKKMELPDTVAIYIDGHENQNTSCRGICTHLLLNKKIKNVLVLTNPRITKTDSFFKQKYKTYSLNNAEKCPTINILHNSYPNTKDRKSIKECIVQSHALLTDAELFFINGKIDKRKSTKTKDQRPGTFVADYFELYKNNNQTLKRIYRNTKIRAIIVALPLAYGPLNHGAKVGFGFFPKYENFNGFYSGYSDVWRNYKSEIDELFGGIIIYTGPTPQEIFHEEARTKLNEALLGNDQEIKQALFSEFTRHLIMSKRKKNIEIKDVDIETFKKVLKDLQIENFKSLRDIISSRPRNLYDLRPYIYERMINTHEKKTFISLAKAITAYPYEYIKKYKNEIQNEKLTEDQKFWIRNNAYLRNTVLFKQEPLEKSTK